MGGRAPSSTRLLTVFDEQARRAAALGCDTMMSPVDKGRGDVARAAAAACARSATSRAARGAAGRGVQLPVRAAQHAGPDARGDGAGRPSRLGLLLDTYHLGRSGATPSDVEDVAPAEIAYVQYSDLPRTGLEPGKALDRLPPGQGACPFREFFARWRAKGYAGFARYEAPNEKAWKRVRPRRRARGLEATRAVLPR